MKHRALGLWLLALSSAIGGCAKTTPPSVGGETNWLKLCTDGAGCARGSCVCGVCTIECRANSECSGNFAGACVSGQDDTGRQACDSPASEPPAGLCLPACKSDGQCGSSFACRSGVCVTQATAQRLDRNPADVVDGSQNFDAGVTSDAAPPITTSEDDAGAETTVDVVEPTPSKTDASQTSQECPNGYYGNIELRVKADFDKLHGCTEVTGKVTIIDSQLEDLHGLEGLRKIGSLTIASTAELATDPNNVTAPVAAPSTGLESLAGLEGLESLGQLSLIGLRLPSLKGLSGLRGMPTIFIKYMFALRDLKGLEAVDWDKLYIEHNPSLRSLEGLNLTKEIGSELSLIDSPQLIDISALQGLHAIDTLTLDSLPIQDLSGLSGLRRAGRPPYNGELTISRCHGLRDLTGLDQLDTFYDLILDDNSNLESLAGIARQAPADPSKNSGGFRISNCPRVRSLAEAVPPGSWTAGEIMLSNMPGITSLADLKGLRGAGLELSIAGCDGLTDLSGLEQVTFIGAFMLQGNPNMQSLKGLDALEMIGDTAQINDMPSLTTLQGLGRVTLLQFLQITGANALKNLQGLEGLESVPATVAISNNAGLVDLTGLDNLKIVGELQLNENPALTSLRKLSAITSTPARLSIGGNSVLPQCEVEWLAKRLNTEVPAGTNGPPGMCEP